MAANKTCPFCGSDSIEVYKHYGEGAGIRYGGYFPECTVCGCRLNYYESREEALKAWNKRASGIKLAEARDEFMDVVYDELSDDADNCRSNRIIDAADEIYRVLHRSGEE